MKTLIVLFSLLVTAAAHAGIKCEVTEMDKGESFKQEFTVIESKDPHGSINMLELSHLSETFGGWVALLQDRIVISLWHNPTGLATSSQAYAQEVGGFHQIILPGKDVNDQVAVVVYCIPQK